MKFQTDRFNIIKSIRLQKNRDNFRQKCDLSLENLYSNKKRNSYFYSVHSTREENKTKRINNHIFSLKKLKSADNSKEKFDFDIIKINKEYDIYISSLKEKLAKIKEEKIQYEISLINLRRKINGLKNEEEESSKQLEETKKYIINIMKNRAEKNINLKKQKKKKKYVHTFSNNFFKETKKEPNLIFNKKISKNNWKNVDDKEIIKNNLLEKEKRKRKILKEIENIDEKENIIYNNFYNTFLGYS